MRILSLDVGSKTIGVAVSDALHLTAQGLETIKWDENDMSSADTRLKQLVNEYEVSLILIGYPINMDGSHGNRAKISEIYANRLNNKFDIPVELVDERLSTMAANRTLLEADVSRKKRKDVVDKMAAMLFLQTYLDKNKRGE